MILLLPHRIVLIISFIGCLHLPKVFQGLAAPLSNLAISCHQNLTNEIIHRFSKPD